ASGAVRRETPGRGGVAHRTTRLRLPDTVRSHRPGRFPPSPLPRLVFRPPRITRVRRGRTLCAVSLLPLEELPGPLPAPVPSPSPARLARRVLTLLPLLLIGAWAAADWRAVRGGTARLASADPWWLLAGVFFTCLGWVTAACVRQGAVPEKLPPGPLLAS